MWMKPTQLEFLEKMEKFERRMIKYSGDDLNTVELPSLGAGERQCILIVHDESVVHANDANLTVWLEGGRKDLRPKSNGSSIMVSGFADELHGLIVDADGKSYELLKPGKNRDGWWTNEMLVAQFTKVIPLFEKYYPNCELLFMFDNSQNHAAYKPDALVASRLNLRIGAKTYGTDKTEYKLRDTSFVDRKGNIVKQVGIKK